MSKTLDSKVIADERRVRHASSSSIKSPINGKISRLIAGVYSDVSEIRKNYENLNATVDYQKLLPYSRIHHALIHTYVHLF